MIKKLFHLLCFAIAGILWTVLLAYLLRIMFLQISGIDIFAAKTWHYFLEYWQKGGVLGGNDLFMLLVLFLAIPLCLYGLKKLYNFSYLRLITVPLNYLLNRGLDDYKAPQISIKNLKVEEKKTLEQVIQERLQAEKRKSAKNASSNADFRKKIIEEIEKNNK